MGLRHNLSLDRRGLAVLAVVLDLFSRIVAGWSMDRRMKAKLFCDALQMALWRGSMPKGVLAHSDRGGQYRSRQYQTLLAKNDLIRSMSDLATIMTTRSPRVSSTLSR